eukprot:Tamp_17073.p2 GENE.Tamp_17073~~Tamp_17073.p2  ORF type:complete len:149 (-),score=42.14 Tamp_17073:471-917(-)
MLSKYVRAFGQTINRMTVWTHRAADGSGTNRITPALSKDEALSTGAEFIGEGFIFGVVVAVTAWEYQQSSAKSAVEKEKAAAKEEEMKKRIEIKETRLASVESRLAELEHALTASGRGQGKGGGGGWFAMSHAKASPSAPAGAAGGAA